MRMDVTETEEIIVHNLPSQKPQAPKQPHNLAVAFNVNMNATISSTTNNRTKWNISFFCPLFYYFKIIGDNGLG